MTQLGWGATVREAGPRPRHNLSVQPTPLLGREHEVAQARQHLLSDEPPVRLLTLTGPGGTGKTRLAVEVARTLLDEFEDGVFVVDLAPIQDARFVASTIAHALRWQPTGDQAP